MIRLIQVILLLGLPLSAQRKSLQDRSLTVCELLTQRNDHADHMVTVRGEIKEGPHGSYLVANPECKFQLIVKGVPWHNLIFLMPPLKHPGDLKLHANFEMDLRAELDVVSKVTKQHFNPDTDTLFETVNGLFRTFSDSDLDKRVNPVLPEGSS